MVLSFQEDSSMVLMTFSRGSSEGFVVSSSGLQLSSSSSLSLGVEERLVIIVVVMDEVERY